MDNVVLNLPHSGTVVPQWALGDMAIPGRELAAWIGFMVDKDVDRLWGFVPEENKQVTAVSRLVVDMERYRSDEDESMARKGMGLYYTHTPDGRPFRVRSEETYARCIALYDEYHRALEAKVTRCIAEHGGCILLDCHSFHDGMEYTGHPTSSFPDVCIGVNGGIGAEAQFVIDVFRAEGYTVKVNEPFAGSLVPLRYWNDPRVRSVMIELNRRVYDNDAFGRVSGLCRGIYEALRSLGKED